MVASAAGGRPTMGLERLVSAASCVTPKLPRDGRRRLAESLGDGTQAQPVTAQIGDLDTLVLDRYRELISRTARRSNGGTNPTATPLR